jgi:hypothetical protein
MPVVIDDTHGFRHVPQSFNGRQRVYLAGGHLTPEFADQLHSILDEMVGDRAGAP